MSAELKPELPPAEGAVGRAFAVLEVVAGLGGATAREISQASGLPLPTVYRLTADLVERNYLVHIRQESRFELGYKLHQLAVSLHQQIGVPRQVRAEITALHQQHRTAAYFAIHRGSQIVVVYVADSPACPRLQSMAFGFHEAPHATAFGKILLSEMTEPQRDRHLGAGLLPALTAHTITDRAALSAELDDAAGSGIAREHGEFVDGAWCAAAAVRAGSGALIGSVAISAPDVRFRAGARALEKAVRATASRVSRFYRSGRTGVPAGPA